MKIKQNISLILGISIPILMILFVAGSIYLPALFAEQPKFNFLYTTGDGYYPSQQYVVRNGMLAKNNIPADEAYKPRLFLYDVVKNESKELSFEDTQNLRLDPNLVSADGFEVRRGSSGGGGPFFFGGGYDYNNQYLVGHNVSRKLSLPSGSDYYYYDFRFLGWITP